MLFLHPFDIRLAVEHLAADAVIGDLARGAILLQRTAADLQPLRQFAVRQVAFAAQRRTERPDAAVQILFHLLQRPEQRLRTFVRLKNRLLVHNRPVLRLAPTAVGRRGQQPFDIRGFVVDLVADLRAGNQAAFAVTLQGPFLNVQQEAHLLVVEPVLQGLVLTPAQLRHPPCQRLDACDQAVVTPFFNHHVLHNLVRLGFRERR